MNGSVEAGLVDAALKTWQQAVDRATKLFGGLDEAGLQREIAPGKNRLIYLYGHLTAVNDAMFEQLRLGERLHPEFDALFVKAPDKTVELPSGAVVKAAWKEVHGRMKVELAKLTPAEWVERHAVVSEEDFAKEPHRNRFTMLLGRTAHLGFHLGQVVLVK
jgi:hypothetical protein